MFTRNLLKSIQGLRKCLVKLIELNYSVTRRAKSKTNLDPFIFKKYLLHFFFFFLEYIFILCQSPVRMEKKEKKETGKIDQANEKI